MSQTKITGLVLSPQPEDGTSWYRCEGPFASLQRVHPELDLIRSSSVGWNEVMRASWVFLQRPIGPQSVEVARQVVRMGKPLWIDWDDNLLAVPEHNPAWHKDQSILSDTVRELASLSSAISVSTDSLQGVFLNITPHQNVFVIPNAYNADYYRYLCVPRIPKDRHPIVYWRGSPSHRVALEFYSPAIVRLAQEFPEVRWVFHGYRPHQLFEQIPSDRITHLDWTGIPDCFFQQFEVAPDIVFSALLPTPFDYARSQIAAIEAVAVGAVAVTPDWPEWSLGSFRYRPGDLDSFTGVLKEPLQNFNRGLFEKLTDDKFGELMEGSSRDLAKVNELRWTLIRKIMTLPSRMVYAVPERDDAAILLGDLRESTQNS